MAIHRLYIDDFESVNYSLIAIHSSLEDFRLAFFINQSLKLKLQKAKNEILINTKFGETHFDNFVFENNENDVCYHLLDNKKEIIIENNSVTFDLFANATIQTSKKVFLLPEFKKVDYFLKIDHQDTIDILEIINILNTIDRISTVYEIEINKIKNKNNLIF